MLLTRLLLIALGGALGSLARYGLAGLVQGLTDKAFPWGTATVNLLGCFAFGLVWSVLEEQITIAPEWRTLLLVGFMGAFTTFSTFAFESGQLLRDQQWLYAVGNIALQNGGGLILLLLGLALGRLL
ncbi:MAG: fluoride efflux transporter CrcB [Planctomycetota bacterium]